MARTGSEGAAGAPRRPLGRPPPSCAACAAASAPPGSPPPARHRRPPTRRAAWAWQASLPCASAAVLGADALAGRAAPPAPPPLLSTLAVSTCQTGPHPREDGNVPGVARLWAGARLPMLSAPVVRESVGGCLSVDIGVERHQSTIILARTSCSESVPSGNTHEQVAGVEQNFSQA